MQIKKKPLNILSYWGENIFRAKNKTLYILQFTAYIL